MQDAKKKEWRIKKISYLPKGQKYQSAHTENPLRSLAMVFGFLIFAAGVGLMLMHKIKPPLGISMIVFGILTITVGSLLAVWYRQRNWVRIMADCLDRDFQFHTEYTRNNGRLQAHEKWTPRILCSFTYKKKEYQVTPDFPILFNFRSRESAQRYINAGVNSKNKCVLWVNPENPLQTLFLKKKLI